AGEGNVVAVVHSGKLNRDGFPGFDAVGCPGEVGCVGAFAARKHWHDGRVIAIHTVNPVRLRGLHYRGDFVERASRLERGSGLSHGVAGHDSCASHELNFAWGFNESHPVDQLLRVHKFTVGESTDECEVASH